MERLAEITHRQAGLRSLQLIVNALRGIAATRTQQARASLAAAARYQAVLTTALHGAVRCLPTGRLAAAAPGSAPSGLIVFTAEHGFVGNFSERALLDAQAATAAEPLFVIGTRGCQVAEELRLTVAWSAPMISHLDALGRLVRQIADEVLRRLKAGTLSGVSVAFFAATAAGPPRLQRRELLPLDLDSLRTLRPQEPLVHGDAGQLIDGLTVEYLLAGLSHAGLESFAAENAARLAAMTAASTHIDEQLAHIDVDIGAVRQAQITDEILDLAAAGQG